MAKPLNVLFILSEHHNPGSGRAGHTYLQVAGRTTCEIHANGWPGSSFAVSDGRMKYVECVGERPSLFDLQKDPQELHDLVIERPHDHARACGIIRYPFAGF